MTARLVGLAAGGALALLRADCVIGFILEPQSPSVDPGLTLTDGNRVPLRVRAPMLPLSRCRLVDPAAQRVAALRVAERAHRPAQALTVAEAMLDRLSLLAIREPGLSDHLAHGDFSGLPAFPPSAAQRVPVGVAQLGYRVGVAVVESDEGLYRDPSLLRAEHAASFLSHFGPGSPPQSRSANLRLTLTTLGIVGHCRADPHKELMPVEDAILPPVADYSPSDDRAHVYHSCGPSPRWQSERNKAVGYYREARSSDLMRVSEIGGQAR